MRADSEASPIVGQSKINIFLSSNFLSSHNFYCISSFYDCDISSLIFSLTSSGLGSKLKVASDAHTAIL